VRGLFKDAIIVSPDRRSTNASTDGILCCQKEATLNLKDEKSRIVPYFSQLILQTSGKGLVSPITPARHDPETGFEEVEVLTKVKSITLRRSGLEHTMLVHAPCPLALPIQH
jgi:hypothetical protein